MAFGFSKSNKSKKEPSLAERSLKMATVLQIPAGSDLEKQVAMIELTAEDLAIAKVLHPYVQEEVLDIVDGFYKKLANVPELNKIIYNNSSFDRLEKTLNRHIIEM